MKKALSAIPIERRIFLIRGLKVMIDTDLAALYGVTTKRLNEQVKRNLQRFPIRYMFQLTATETYRLRLQNLTPDEHMRSHIATGSKRNRRYRPFVFTEHGAIMLASVINSPTAIQASMAVVDAFVHLRELLATNKDLSRKLDELESKYDAQFKVVFDAIRELMDRPAEDLPEIKGFRHE